MSTLISFDEFRQQVTQAMPKRRHRLQFKDLTSDARTASRTDLPAYEFQDGDHGYTGHYSRDGEWVITYEGASGFGSTFREADEAMQFEYNNMNC